MLEKNNIFCHNHDFQQVAKMLKLFLAQVGFRKIKTWVQKSILELQ